MPLQDPLQPVQRKVIAVLAHDHVAEQSRRREALLDRLQRLVRRHDLRTVRRSVALALRAAVRQADVFDHLHLRRNVVELLVRLLADDVPQLPAAWTGLLVFRQVMNDLLTRQIRRQSATAMTFTPLRHRRFLIAGILRRQFRNGFVDQVLEQQPLTRIHLLRRAPEVTTQQRLHLVLQVVDLAQLPMLFFEKLIITTDCCTEREAVRSRVEDYREWRQRSWDRP